MASSPAQRRIGALALSVALAVLIAGCGAAQSDGSTEPVHEPTAEPAKPPLPTTEEAGVGPAAPTPPPGSCRRDSQCVEGAEWCIEGRCAPCNNSGRVCRIYCEHGLVPPRHGCQPCHCNDAPAPAPKAQ